MLGRVAAPLPALPAPAALLLTPFELPSLFYCRFERFEERLCLKNKVKRLEMIVNLRQVTI